MSLNTETPSNQVISVRKDPNATKRVQLSLRRTLIVNIPPQIKFQAAFEQGANYTAPSIYDFCRQIMYSWYPNFTSNHVSGSLTINGLNVGNTDFLVLPSQTIDQTNNDLLFTSTQDTASAMIFVKGDLTIAAGRTLTPPVRKLFTVLYVSGNLTMTDDSSTISMTQRGANHSGGPGSDGFVAPVRINISSNVAISATGGAGAARNDYTYPGEALGGTNGDTTLASLSTGGGSGGFLDSEPV